MPCAGSPALPSVCPWGQPRSGTSDCPTPGPGDLIAHTAIFPVPAPQIPLPFPLTAWSGSGSPAVALSQATLRVPGFSAPWLWTVPTLGLHNHLLSLLQLLGCGACKSLKKQLRRNTSFQIHLTLQARPGSLLSSGPSWFLWLPFRKLCSAPMAP